MHLYEQPLSFKNIFCNLYYKAITRVKITFGRRGAFPGIDKKCAAVIRLFFYCPSETKYFHSSKWLAHFNIEMLV